MNNKQTVKIRQHNGVIEFEAKRLDFDFAKPSLRVRLAAYFENLWDAICGREVW